MSNRRRNDPVEADFSHEREVRFFPTNGERRAAVAVGLPVAILFAVIGFLLAQDRAHLQETATSALEKATRNETTLAVIQQQLSGIREDVIDIKELLKERKGR